METVKLAEHGRVGEMSLSKVYPSMNVMTLSSLLESKFVLKKGLAENHTFY